MSEGSRGSGFLSGLVIGGLAGAAIAMILAPQAGEDTRDLLRAKAREASERVRDVAEDLAQHPPFPAGDLLARGKQIVEEARARFDEAVAEGKEAAQRQRTTLDNDN